MERAGAIEDVSRGRGRARGVAVLAVYKPILADFCGGRIISDPARLCLPRREARRAFLVLPDGNGHVGLPLDYGAAERKTSATRLSPAVFLVVP